MKKNIILSVCLASLFMTACKEWLTVYPEDEVAAGELFENGEGYRTALNGIYQQLSEEPLYGKNLTYGVVEAMGQVYDKEYFGASNYAMEYELTYSDKTSIPDLKLLKVVSKLSQDWFGENINDIGEKDRIRLIGVLKRKYKATPGQIARVLSLDREMVFKIVMGH